MKKIVLVLALLPLSLYANDEVNVNSYAKNNCEQITDPVEKKECFNIAKKNEARENYKNFEENNHTSYQDNF